MGYGGLRGVGLAFPLVALVGCTTAPSDPPVQRADVAVPSYAAPSGAPAFCVDLARTVHLTALPDAVGTLTARPEDVGAKLDLNAAGDELRDVLQQVDRQPGAGALAGALRELVAALREAGDVRLTDDIRTRISTGLDDVGRDAQSACEFPS